MPCLEKQHALISIHKEIKNERKKGKGVSRENSISFSLPMLITIRDLLSLLHATEKSPYISTETSQTKVFQVFCHTLTSSD